MRRGLWPQDDHVAHGLVGRTLGETAGSGAPAPQKCRGDTCGGIAEPMSRATLVEYSEGVILYQRDARCLGQESVLGTAPGIQ